MSESVGLWLTKGLEAFSSGLLEIWSHKLRSLLTLFGIIVGTFALIVMTSLLTGARDMVQDIFSAIGWDGAIYVRHDTSNLRGERYIHSRGLSLEDVAALRTRTQYVESMAPVIEFTRTVKVGKDDLYLKIRGTTPEFLKIRNRELKSGRSITDIDLQHNALVCVVSEDMENNYFYGAALGKTINFYGIRCSIVGVVANLKNDFHGSMFYNESNIVMLPITTVRSYLLNKKILDGIVMKIDMANMDSAVAEVERTLEVLHYGVRDFSVDNIAQEMLEAQQTASRMLRIWNIILGAISSTSLLVGGIGILSIMLISISERIFEIGLRKALGATDTEVFIQFLIESVTISLIGATTGALLGITFVGVTAKLFPITLSLSKLGVTLAVVFAIAIGISFGWYPAHKAASLQPVDALRR